MRRPVLLALTLGWLGTACVPSPAPPAGNGDPAPLQGDSGAADAGLTPADAEAVDASDPVDAGSTAQDAEPPEAAAGPDRSMSAPDSGVERDAGPAVDAGAATGLSGLSLRLEEATPEQIGLYAPTERAFSPSTTIAVRYRAAGAATWREAHPLLRIHPEWNDPGAPEAPVDAFAGTIFDLEPGVAYEVELVLREPGQADQRGVYSAQTRSLPPAAGAPTIRAAPGDDLQAKINLLSPGAVLELAAGTYEVDRLAIDRAGAPGRPITIRGADRATVVIHDAGGAVIQLQHASYLVIEDLTLSGSGTDSGTNADSVGVSFWDGAFQEEVTFRNLDLNGVDMGIVAYGATRGILVYNCELRGNNLWNAAFVESNRTWNDDGLRLPGRGNCAFENSLDGFGDAFAVNNGVASTAIYYYRNRIRMSGDDAFEADYGTRNIGFYDNHIANTSTFLSLDPLWGGPLYCFRNVVLNTVRGPFKLNNTNSGFMIYSNTIVRTEGTTGWGWAQSNNGELRNYSYRNNLLIYRGGGTHLLALESGGNDPLDFTNNAWFPDGAVWWTNSGGSFGSMAEARQQMPATTPLFGRSRTRHEHDLLSPSDPFVVPLSLGPTHLTEVGRSAPPYVPTLRAGEALQSGGVAIPNVTDGYAGPSPAIGAVIEGRAQPRWGALRP